MIDVKRAELINYRKGGRFVPNTRAKKSMEPGWDRHYDDEESWGIQIPDYRDGLLLQEFRNAAIEK